MIRAAAAVAATLALAAGAFLIAGAAARADDLAGHAAAWDGDGLMLGGVHVRLHGIDAFEREQACIRDAVPYPCGEAARRQLERLLARHGWQVTCAVIDTDRYGRPVAACHAGNTDLALAMVEAGWALAWERYLEGEKLERYRAAQEGAEAAGRGAWAGRFERPWDWRWRQ